MGDDEDPKEKTRKILNELQRISAIGAAGGFDSLLKDVHDPVMSSWLEKISTETSCDPIDPDDSPIDAPVVWPQAGFFLDE